MIRSIRTFLTELRKVIDIEEAYLFGSYARGDWVRESDVDLIIVSSDFRDMKFTERLDLVNEISWRLKITPPLEVIPLTPEELRRGSVVVDDARRYWIRVL
ncbi:MAG: nucleotidyltransferase domain-containing protein [Candidatus Korarchaeota archaeon]|nr:nucleotidyltransferase domain-containing protein [Candidatus Korarchaeota archaeon]